MTLQQIVVYFLYFLILSELLEIRKSRLLLLENS